MLWWVMALMHSRDAECLHAVARASIETGMLRGVPLEPDLASATAGMLAEGASFVTLHRAGVLRGCVGTLEALRPLVVDVAHNAFRSAFWDPRFHPLSRSELTEIDVHISVLSAPEAVECASEADLLERLRPGIDGLILHAGHARATFLPAVWEQAPEPREFLRNLKVKAGLPADYWSTALRFERYAAHAIPSPARAAGRSDEPSVDDAP